MMMMVMVIWKTLVLFYGYPLETLLSRIFFFNSKMSREYHGALDWGDSREGGET